MSTYYDEDLAEQWAIDDAIEEARRSPYEGEDPPQDYLDAEAKERTAWHREKDHGGRECTCATAPITTGEESPF